MSAKLQTHAELRQLQRLAGAVIMRPLDPKWRTQRRWIDNRPTRHVVGEFIKPNDRLTSLERIEIYNKQYWFRLIDCLFDDLPGLRAVLGHKKFTKLLKAYLTKNPSRSFSLRNLAGRLPGFIAENPKLVAPHLALATDMANFEWAQIIAFDGPQRPVISVDDLLGKDPAKLRLGIQPYLTVLHLRYPLDEFVIQLKKNKDRRDASNAMEEDTPKTKSPRKRRILPKRQNVWVAVHRHDLGLYYKRLDPNAGRLISALKNGHTLARALNESFDKQFDPEKLKDWFHTWSALGWFCKPVARR